MHYSQTLELNQNLSSQHSVGLTQRVNKEIKIALNE